MGVGTGKIARGDMTTLFIAGAIGGLPDGQLLGRFVERREEAAFEALVRRHRPMGLGVCCRVLRHRHDAEDAFQATFLVLARRAASVAPRERLPNWLHGVACRTALKARAMRASRRVRERPEGAMAEAEAPSQDARDDLSTLLDRELGRLPARYRIPIILCDLEGKGHKEAAIQLGWPVGTLSGRLSRARAMLGRRLNRGGMAFTGMSAAAAFSGDAARAGVPASLASATARAASASGMASAGM